jgi:hypothetical protein
MRAFGVAVGLKVTVSSRSELSFFYLLALRGMVCGVAGNLDNCN